LVAGLPGVQSVRRGAVLIVSGTDPAGPSGPRRQLAVAEIDPAAGQLVGPPHDRRRAAARADRAEEAAIDEELAAATGLRVGSIYRIGLYTLAQFGSVGERSARPADGPMVAFTGRRHRPRPNDLLPPADSNDDMDPDESSELSLTPAFWDRYGPDWPSTGSFFRWSSPGSGRPAAFTKALKRRFGERAFINNAPSDKPGDVAIIGVGRAIAVEVCRPAGGGRTGSTGGSVLVGQTLGRQILLEANEGPTLRSLGMTQAQLVGVGTGSGGGGGRPAAAAIASFPLGGCCRHYRRLGWRSGPSSTEGSWSTGRCWPWAARDHCTGRAGRRPGRLASCPRAQPQLEVAARHGPRWPSVWWPAAQHGPAYGWRWYQVEAEPRCRCGPPWSPRRRRSARSPHLSCSRPARPPGSLPSGVWGDLGSGDG
jgi:hypothetical protein